MSRLVQFIHPGGEPPHKGRGIKPWNTGAHRRSFLVAPGTFRSSITGPSEQSPRLAFWGEWEAPAQGIPLPGGGAAHTAFLPRPPTFHGAPGLQNTDPFVFDGPFLYSCCKQVKKDGRATYLRGLERGDVLLFGSRLGPAHEGRFVLDTVFVVADGTPYGRRAGPRQLAERVPPSFVEATLRPLAFQGGPAAGEQASSVCAPEDDWDDADEETWCGPCGSLPDVEYRLYRGATPEAPVDGMFSFSPARVATEAMLPFERPTVERYVQPDLRQGSKQCLRGPHNEHLVKEAWSYVAELVLGLGAGLVLGTSFQCTEAAASSLPP